MFVQFGNDPEAVVRAANLCCLDSLPGPRSFRHWLIPSHGLPPWARAADFDPDQTVVVLTLLPREASRCSRPPNEVGVFARDGRYWGLWDSRRDGYGLNAYVGADGGRIKSFYAIEAADLAAARMGFKTLPGRTGRDEVTTMEYSDIMGQKKIIVRVTKTGQTTVETSGFVGKECQDATKQLEAALGTVESEQATPEMYKVPEQTVKVGG